MDRRTFLATTAGFGASIGIAGCTGGSAEQSYDVGMTIREFDPETITVEPGTTVVWRNTSSHTHTVTAYQGRIPDGAAYFASGGFDSQQAAEEAWAGGSGGAIQPGEVFEHEFVVPGPHHYYCIPHEAGGMVGTVEVTESSSSSNQ